MLVNQTTALLTPRLLLRPYRQRDVVQYHEWMSNAELREATASELLSLEEEYEMQQSWARDPDKLTFIISTRLASSSLDSSTLNENEDEMIGDVNLFMSKVWTNEEATEQSVQCEVEIMIASSTSRGRGFAAEALRAFLQYCSETLNLDPSQFIARIGIENQQSIGLFTKLGFVRGAVNEVFKEVEMRFEQDRWSWKKEYVVLTDPI